MSQPFKLLRLQQVDSQLDQARSRLNEIEAILNDHAALRQAQARGEETENSLSEAQKKLRHAEQEVKAQCIKIEQTEASLYGGKIRNPKELQDLQKDSVSLKNYLAVLEDRQLELMLALEDAEAVHQSALQELDIVRAKVDMQNQALVEEKNGLLRRVEGLEADRLAVAGSIEAEDMKLYEGLRQQRRGVAVARVVDNACAACGSILTPGQVQAATSPTQISRCGFCGRIVYAG